MPNTSTIAGTSGGADNMRITIVNLGDNWVAQLEPSMTIVAYADNSTHLENWCRYEFPDRIVTVETRR